MNNKIIVGFCGLKPLSIYFYEEKQTDKHQKGFDSWTHFVSMLFLGTWFGLNPDYALENLLRPKYL